jgi:hypothetical protein
MRIGMFSVLGSTVFFVVTNFGCWLVGIYPDTWAGLRTCYLMALPFFRYTLLGDLLYSGALFGLFELASRRAAGQTAARSAS